MFSEVIQPRLPIPDDLNDQLANSQLKVTHTEWLRQVVPQLRLDASKLVCAFTLGNMMGDDGNEFVPPIVRDVSKASRSKESVLILLDLEANVPELPGYFRKHIQEVRDQLVGFNWTDMVEYDNARNLWKREIRDYTINQITSDIYLQSAREYEKHHYETVSRYWNNFLHGTPLDADY